MDNQIVFKSKDAALLFARNFLKQQMEHWGGFEAASRYRLFADALRLALEDDTISEEDFWQNDAYVVNKLVTSKNKKVQTILSTLRHKSLSHLPKSDVTVYKKFRYVDPLFISNDKLVRTSHAVPRFAEEIDKARKVNEQGILLPSI